MVMGNNHKYFSPSLKSEILAARVYDRYVIQCLGLSAKTNFSYTRLDLIKILKDIESDIMYNLSAQDSLNRQRISFRYFKIEQDEIESIEDIVRIQSMPTRRNFKH